MRWARRPRGPSARTLVQRSRACLRRPGRGSSLTERVSGVSATVRRVKARGLTRAVIVPDYRALRVLFDRLVVARQLGIDFGAKAGQLCLEARVVGHTLGEHLREHVDGGLQIAVALDHDAKDEVLEVSVRLLFLHAGRSVVSRRTAGQQGGNEALLTLKEHRSCEHTKWN